MSIINIIKNNVLFKKNNQEDLLLKKEPITVIIVTDLHGSSKYIDKDYIKSIFCNYDICFILGDLDSNDLNILLPYLDLSKTYGVYGNHDDYNDKLYEKFGITNIHGKQIKIKDSTFIGWEGSYKYKKNAIGMTQEESIIFEKQLPISDYLVSHDGPFRLKTNTPHAGLKGISDYQKRTNCFILRGHLHEQYKTDKEQCFYKIEKIILNK